jgi:hypothetical protein
MNKKDLMAVGSHVIVFVGLAVAVCALLTEDGPSTQQIGVAALVGVIIGAVSVLVTRRWAQAWWSGKQAEIRHHRTFNLAIAMSAVPVAVIGSFADLWSRPFPVALGYGALIGLGYVILLGLGKWVFARWRRLS